MFSQDHLAPYLPCLEKAGHIYIGYSGGLDSHVLLHSVAALVGSEKVTAIHINHQLSANASQWQQHCADQCQQLGVGFQAHTVAVVNDGDGVEQAARTARYGVFTQALGEGDLLLLGHHADDQAETVLYRLLRSSGPRGLAGIPERRTLGSGELLRPLLSFDRADLMAYTKQQGLQWIEDESNQQLTYDRNFLRNRVVPVLQERWPDLATRLGCVANLCRQHDDFSREVALSDLAAANERPERLGVSLDLATVTSHSHTRRQNLVRFWLEQHGYQMPPQVRLERLHRELIDAREDANPVIELGDCELRRYHGRLYLLPSLPELPAKCGNLLWDGQEPLYIEGAGVLVSDHAFPEELQVRFRRGGERAQPIERKQSQSLKKLFQEYQLEPWLRERVPLIYQGEQLVAVAGLFSCEPHVSICWQSLISK